MNAKEIESKLVGQIVAEDIKTSVIFEKNGLLLNGNLASSVYELKRNNNVNFNGLISDLSEYCNDKENYQIDFNLASTDTLIDYIERFHHQTIKNTLPEIINKGKEINDKYGEKSSAIRELYSLTMAFSEDIFNHMDMEEKKLFPVIRTIIHYKQDIAPLKNVFEEKIKIAFDEHEEATGLLKVINKLSEGFNPPPETGSEGVAYYKMLNSFVDNLYEHIHIESNILFNRIKKELNLI